MGPGGPSLVQLAWLRPCQDLKKRFLTEKNRPIMSTLPSHAGIMPVTEKNLIITGFLVKICFIQT